jgi:crotonobetaine/carnitine-CoA ligase
MADSVPEYLTAASSRDLLWRRFAGQPERPALYVERTGRHGSGHWLTYGDLGAAVERTAYLLMAAGIAPGDRVGVMLPNGEAFVQVWLALITLNVTMMPVNTGLAGAGLRHVLLDADLDLLIVDPILLPAVRAACGDTPPARRVTTVGVEGSEARRWPSSPVPSPARGRGADAAGVGSSDESFLLTPYSSSPLSHAMGEGPGEGAALVSPSPPLPSIDPADPALIIYTSGTTGPSKGVVLSRMAQLWHGMNYLRDFIRLGPGETGYTPLPLFHVSAQGFTLGCLLGGAAVVVGQRFQPFSFWETVCRHKVRAFNYVGAMVPLLWRRPPRPNDRDNPVERAVGSATAPELHEAFEQRFGLELIETYGQSEMAGLWLMNGPGERQLGTVGRPRPWLTATVLRPDGAEAAPGETGEIALRPEHPLLMTRGYFRDAEATARAFPGDGWYHTGDAGERDEAGWFRFRGRLKDFIRRRGENISAFEIEREALAHPAVREAAAVGVPSPLGEEEVKLCVLLHERAALDPEALDAFLRPRLAVFMRPRYIEIRVDFPRTPTQRVQKF